MRSIRYIPVALLFAGVASATVWWNVPTPSAPARLPEEDHPGGTTTEAAVSAIVGKLTAGSGVALADAKGTWQQFRGDNHTGVATDATPLSETISASKVVWTTALGEGYAGTVIARGRVYMIDYDAEKREDAVRCLSLADGQEIWRLSYPMDVKRNHGMTRTVPAVRWDDKGGVVVTLGPKCHLVACDAETGKMLWIKDLAREYGTKVPPWYAGQCPIVEPLGGPKAEEAGEAVVVVAPVGRKVLMTALDLRTGKTVWETPNTRAWSMTHSSVIPMEVGGKRVYVYCGSGGVAGVDAQSGTLLWDTDAWKVKFATVPSPVDLGEGRLLLSGGYGAGAMILQVTPPTAEGAAWTTEVVRRLTPEEFGAEQHTPILSDGYVYGVRADGLMVCLDRNGDVKWTSGSAKFGLGAYLLVGERIYAINDTGVLSAIEAKPEKFTLTSKAKVMTEAKECWGPLALADGRLVVRDLTRLVCVDVRANAAGAAGEAKSAGNHGGHHE